MSEKIITTKEKSSTEQNGKENFKLKKNKLVQLKKRWVLYLLAAIVISYYIVFCYVPMYGILIGFKEFSSIKGIWGSPWADNYGFKYFIKFLTDKYFWTVTKNTLIISAYRIILVFPAPIILALFMNELRCSGFKRTVQTIIYLPRFISWVIISGLVVGLLSPTTGMINEIIKMWGGEPIDFLVKPEFFRTLLIVSDIWKNAGWGTIIYMAALSGVNPELYEAAEIDGAGRFRKMWSISISCIRSTIIMQFILAISGILNGGFDQIFVLYNPMTYETGDIIDTYVYRMAFKNGKFAYSTAVGLFKSLIGVVLIVGSDRIFKAIGERGII